MGLSRPSGHRLAEPLLWFAVAVGALMTITAAASRTYVETAGGRPVAGRIGLEAGVLAVLLLGGAAAALLRPVAGFRAGAVAAALGLLGAAHAFHRISDIDADLRPVFVGTAVVAGVVLLVLAVRATPRPREMVDAGAAGQLVAAVLALVAVAVAAVVAAYSSWGWLGVWTEEQPAWDYGAPLVLVATGLVAAAVQALRRDWRACGVALLLTALVAGLLQALTAVAV